MGKFPPRQTFFILKSEFVTPTCLEEKQNKTKQNKQKAIFLFLCSGHFPPVWQTNPVPQETTSIFVSPCDIGLNKMASVTHCFIDFSSQYSGSFESK